jgi:hypothetical protein
MIPTIGNYLLALIKRRKSNWLHVGSIPMLPTKNPHGAISGAGEGTGQHNLKCGLNPKT